MKTLIYDPFAGISGDMHMGAMADLGVPQEYILETIRSLDVSGWSISFKRDQRKGISGTRALVSLDGEASYTAADHSHEPTIKLADGSVTGHSHHNDHNDHHDHHEVTGHSHAHPHGHTHAHAHRNLGDIARIIQGSSIPEGVKRRSLEMFTAVARAEAKVHDKPVDEVHFHEVGAVDSIVDIVAAAAGIEYLKPDRILSFPPELGGGFVNCAHGRIPVPAPATVEILQGVPVKTGAVQVETTTPTGAAILKCVVDEFIKTPRSVISRIGYGVGTRDTEIPNVLRVYLAEEPEDSLEEKNASDKAARIQHGIETDALMIECSLDDMSPELIGYAVRKLWDAHAKDVYLTPVYMKKGRPGTILTVMTTEAVRDDILRILFTETTTAGVREYPVRQTMLQRDYETLETSHGNVKIKRLYYQGKEVSRKTEFDDISAAAERKGVPLKTLQQEIEGILGEQSLGEKGRIQAENEKGADCAGNEGTAEKN